MVYLHHGSKDVVVKLASKLRGYHFIDTKRLADRYAVNLKGVVVFFNTSGIDARLLLNSPAFATEESADEVDRREITAKGGVIDHKELLQFCKPSCDKRLYLHMAVWSDDTTFDSFCVFADKDIAERLQSYLEDCLICHLVYVGSLSINLFCPQKMPDSGIVDFHLPLVNEILPNGESFAVIMVLSDNGTIFKFILFLSPLA